MLRRLLTVLVPMLITAAPVLAQDDDGIEWINFESESGLVKISIPEGWPAVMDGALEDPTGVSFANSEAVLERVFEAGDALTTGDKIVSVIGFPASLTDLMGFVITDGTTPTEIIETMSTFFFEDHPSRDAEFGESDVIELEGYPPVGIIPMSRESSASEGMMFAYLKDDYVIYGFAAAYTDEYDDAFQTLTIETILSYEITISANELLAREMDE